MMNHMSKPKSVYVATTSYDYEGIGSISVHASVQGAIDSFGSRIAGKSWSISDEPGPDGTIACHLTNFGVSYEVTVMEIEP